jgi:D-glycero-alpha-D-manno-heptose 1-phosphate guanylyltransferase
VVPDAPEAIILAGGFGTRLSHVLVDLPKPLAPVNGRPFVAYLLDALAGNGVRHAVLATGYLAEKIEAELGDDWRGMRLSYSVEDVPLGTGGAVRRAAAATNGGPAVVLNGDTYLEFDANAFAGAMRAAGADLGVALAKVPDVSRYGAVKVSDGRVVAFGEKVGQGPGLINAGVYFLSRKALAELPARESFSFETDVLAPAAAAGRLHAYTDTRGFIDIGIPEDYARSQDLAKQWRVGS